jgi:malate synthase
VFAARFAILRGTDGGKGRRMRVDRAGLRVDPIMASFIEDEALPGTGIAPDRFWAGLADLVAACGPVNRALLERRADLQAQIDAWHYARAGQPADPAGEEAMLRAIGYVVPEGPGFTIGTAGCDAEITSIAGPQLVVPVMNARYALNAANARWGSLYDALYGTDALGEAPWGRGFDAERGARAVAWAKAFLDDAVPLQGMRWAAVTGLTVAGGTLVAEADARRIPLADPGQFVGHVGAAEQPTHLVLRRHGLHLELVVDRSTPVGATDPAGISDVFLESALTAIMDCEDSVAAVDAADKVVAWRNWLGLMKGDLTETVTKAGRTFERRLNPDYDVTGPDGGSLRLRGRALMLVRNVGHLMTSPAVHDAEGREVGEGLLDAAVTVLCAMHDLNKTTGPRNTETGAVYVVKPKMHGPDEVALAVDVFDRVEAMLGLPANTVKLGIMDEERRTSVNLKECIRAAQSRICFINTGFLDRTGDEIHTGMAAGPMVPKGEMKAAAWISAYEDRNVDIGLACGFRGRAQIGKGMWAAPDRMAAMLRDKIAHPMAGASCAWVPSPTAAVLHATHYHRVDVAARQAAIAAMARPARLTDLLTLPLATGRNWSEAEIEAELDNNAQGILGYVVRWVDQGIGCSKVPDIHDVALMEDRATCRISAQALANWLAHGVVSEARVRAAFRRMAAKVDGQNADDPLYRPMAPACDGVAFGAALDLVLKGRDQPSGYTEPILHAARAERKRLDRAAG